MIIVERKRAQERKKLQHQGGSLAGVVSGGGPPNVGTLLPQVTWRAGLWIKAAKMCQAPGPSLHGMLLGARLPVYILSYSCTSKREACPQPMLCIRTTYPEGKPMTLSRLHVDCRLSTVDAGAGLASRASFVVCQIQSMSIHIKVVAAVDQ
jgi:hypothetical protein